MKKFLLYIIILITPIIFSICESGSDDVYSDNCSTKGKIKVIIQNNSNITFTILSAESGGEDLFEKYGGVGPDGFELPYTEGGLTTPAFEVEAGTFEVTWKNCAPLEECDDKMHSANKKLCAGKTYYVAFLDEEPWYEITEKEE